MDIDEALIEVGGMRRYHWLLFTLISLSLTIPLGINTMLYVFIGWTPGHHCRAPAENISVGLHTFKYDYDNTSTISVDIFNNTQPQCHYRKEGINDTFPCANGWTYDIQHGQEASVVTEWDLVCENNFHAELAETLSGVGALVGLIFIAPLTDKFGRKPIYFGCYFIHLVLQGSIAFISSLTAYHALRFVSSIFVDVFTCAALTILMELYSTKHRTFVGIGFEFYWLFAYFYLAMLMYFIRLWRTFLLVSMVPCFIFLLIFWLLPESAPWLLIMGRKKEAKEALELLARRNGVKWKVSEELAYTKEVADEDQLPFMKQMLLLAKDPILRKHSLMNALYWFANYCVYMGIIMTTPSLAGDKYLSFILGGVIEAPAYILCFFIVKYSRRIPTIIFHILAGLSLLTAALIIGLDLGGEHQRTIMLVVTLIGKFGITCSFSIIVLYTIELFPTNLRGAGSSYGRIAGRFGSILSPFLALWLKHNTWSPLVFMGILSLLTGLATFVLPETCDKQLPQTLEDVYGLYQKSHKPVSTDEKANREVIY